MTILACQLVLAAGTLLPLLARWQSYWRHKRRLPVRRPPVVRANGEQRDLPHALRERPVALSTLPMPIKGTIEVPVEVPDQRVPSETAQPPARPAQLRFETPDVELMQRVLDGLRALPESRDTPPA